jgi:hypothetical protein
LNHKRSIMGFAGEKLEPLKPAFPQTDGFFDRPARMREMSIEFGLLWGGPDQGIRFEEPSAKAVSRIRHNVVAAIFQQALMRKLGLPQDARVVNAAR